MDRKIFDREAYDKYIELKNNPIFKKPGRIIQTSDENLTIDLATTKYNINNLIIDLPGSEQDSIIRSKDAYQVLHSRILALENKAYGKPYTIKHANKKNPIVNQLIDEKKSELLDYFAQYINVKDVHKIIVEEWGYHLNPDILREFKNKNIKKILDLQKKYRSNLDSIRLSHKKSRLEEYQELYIKKKQKWVITDNRLDYKQLLETLKLIKEEVEENKLKIELEGKLNIEHTLSMHIGIEMLKGMSINDIIIARVASKQNINPAYLINSLHTSVYSKFTGFKKPDGDIKKQEVQYPSAVVYQWNEVEKLYEVKRKEQDNLKQLPKITQGDEKTRLAKELLLKKIKEKKDLIENSLDNQQKERK